MICNLINVMTARAWLLAKIKVTQRTLQGTSAPWQK